MSCACVRVDQGETVSLDSLLRYVAPLIPEVPYAMALDMLRAAYTDFARKTKLLVSHQTLAIQKDVKNYFLEPPEGHEVFGVLQYLDKEYLYARFPTPNRWFYAWGQSFYLEGNRELVFVEAPSYDYTDREIVLHLIPSPCATIIPSEIATPYGQGIAMGALADMLEIPNKPWSNVSLAQVKRRQYSIAVANGISAYMNNRGATSAVLRPVRIL